jgi:hypothetical protein
MPIFLFSRNRLVVTAFGHLAISRQIAKDDFTITVLLRSARRLALTWQMGSAQDLHREMSPAGQT